MNLSIKHLLCGIALVCAGSASVAAPIAPFGQDSKESWTAKYFYATNRSGETPSQNWYAADFDDSSWATTQGPISNSTSCDYYETKWPENYSTYWLRRYFEVSNPDDLENVHLKVLHDDGCVVYLNGVEIYNQPTVKPETQYKILTDEEKKFIRNGNNVLAVYVSDTGGAEAYIDFGIDTFETLTVNVDKPGTLGDLILEQVENFSDVFALTVSGTLGSKDIECLRQRLTNVRVLDMSGVDMISMQDEMFRDHQKLQSVKLPDKLENIGNYTFYNCTSLRTVAMPESLKSIGEYAFYYTNVEEVILPEGLQTIGNYAFYRCASNKRVYIPGSVKIVPDCAFYDNYSLGNVTFGEGLEGINGRAFCSANKLESVKFPSTLRYIGNSAFADCDVLADISLNEGLYQISDNAFSSLDSLRQVVLPSSLVRADSSPFDYCQNLKKVTCLSIEPPYMTDQIPYGCSMEGRELYVPALSINTYKQTKGWDKFLNFIPIDTLPGNIVVIRDMTLTLPESIPADYKPNVAISHVYDLRSYGRLKVKGEGTLSMSKFSYVLDPSAHYNNSYSDNVWYTSLINDSHLRADSVVANLFTYRETWTFVSFPFDVKKGDILPNCDGTTSYVVRRYSGANRAAAENEATWITLGDDDVLHAGEGYIIQAVRYIGNRRQDYSGFEIPALNNGNKNNVFISDDAKVAVSDYPAEFAHNRGWNLIGNPYPCYYDSRFMNFESPITVWDMYNRTYRVFSPVDDSYIINPGESFFIQAPVGATEIVFAKEGRQSDATVRTIDSPARVTAMDNGRIRADIAIEGNGSSDATRVVMNDAAALTYETACDAAKFFSPESSVPQIYTYASGVEYAINERPLSDGTVALAVRAGAAGSYTISLQNDITNFDVMLEDHETGISVNLCASEGYTFTVAEAGTLADRFTLHFDNGNNTLGVTDIEAGDKENSQHKGIFTIDGKAVEQPASGGVYIRDGKKIYVK